MGHPANPRSENPDLGHPPTHRGDTAMNGAQTTRGRFHPRSPKARDRGHPQLDKIPRGIGATRLLRS